MSTGIKRFFSPVPRPNAPKPTESLESSDTSPQAQTNSPFPKRLCTRLPTDFEQTTPPKSSPSQSPVTPKQPHTPFLSTPISKLRLNNDASPAAPSTPVSRVVPASQNTPRSVPSSLSSQSMPKTFSSPRVANPPQPQVGSDDLKFPHLNYKFLYPPHRRDINEHEPDHPDYDEKTLYVPEAFLNAQTPALRQWWLIKQRNMDAILFFKMGKFYELFNEDAVVGVNNLDIMYMKGDDTKPAHAGFPEIAYEKFSKILIERGYKVIRIEQTETPAMMEERCQSTGRKGKFDKVVRREVCRATTRGTQMLGIMESVFHSSSNQYLLALYETNCETSESTSFRSKLFGVCFIDVTIGIVHLGQFDDDANLSKLNILLAHHSPTEILFERGNLSQETHKAILRTGAQLTSLRPNKEFWPIKKALSYLKIHHIFEDDSVSSAWPQNLKSLFEEGDISESLLCLEPKDEYKFALDSFGAIVYYLQSQMIADQVLNCATFELYQTPLGIAEDESQGERKNEISAPMIMDHIALRNMEIFENSDGQKSCTLFESINHCKTHFGQRLLKSWLCTPLRDIKQINNRLDAVEALVNNNNASLMTEISHVLGQTPDLERLLSKIKSQCFKSESDTRAIMFDGDQYSKAKISSFLNLLQNFKRLRKFIMSISKVAKNSNSKIIGRLLSFTTDDGLYPDYSATLEYFDSAFDHALAQKTGKIVPAPGVDKNYDACLDAISNVKNKLEEYLEDQKQILRCRHIEYFGSAKNRYQIQVPESYCKNVPNEYRIETTRKGYKRYYTPTIDKLFQKLTLHEEEMKKTLDGIMSTIFEQFTRKMKLWAAAIECIGILDVLQSIASFVRTLKANNVDVCRPEIMENNGSPLLEYRDGRHPALVKVNPNYIPNDLSLDERLVLLSGANMGGKSTLMRQTALLVILAQIGCYVPASRFRLTPVDRIFSRLGASDSILEGESTFYTELVETSAMLRYATKNSLLLLDELGRGTSTFDGTAIAYSVIQEISDNIRCRCLFSTHYHTLVRDFQGLDHVRMAHMACKIETEDGEDIDADPLKESITFLYKIVDGPVARSYGFNVAKLAGIQDSIIRSAFEKAKEIELRCKVLGALQTVCQTGGPKDGSELKKRALSMIEA